MITSPKRIYHNIMGEKLKWLWQELKLILIGVLIVLIFRSFGYEPFNIPSGSMYPTLMVGDYIMVDKSEYGYSRFSMPFSPPIIAERIFSDTPKRGDVAVFRNPQQNDIDYIKRVIGLPGDRIQLKNGRLYINGQMIERQRLDDYTYEYRRGVVQSVPHYKEILPNGVSYNIIEIGGDRASVDNTTEYQVPDGHYFMMGDNRDGSQDSRFLSRVGYVPLDHYIGPAELIFYSIEEDVRWYNPISWFHGIRGSRIFTQIQ